MLWGDVILRSSECISNFLQTFGIQRTRLIRPATADDAELVDLTGPAECHIDHLRYIDDIRRVAAIHICGTELAQRVRVRDCLRATERHVVNGNHIDDIHQSIATGGIRIAIARAIARIAHSIAILILLSRIPHQRAVIADIPNPIRVSVRLVKRRDARAIVTSVTPGVGVCVDLSRIGRVRTVVTRISQSVSVGVHLARVW